MLFHHTVCNAHVELGVSAPGICRHFGGSAPGICPSFWWQCTWNMPSFWWQCTWNMPVILVAVYLEYAVIFCHRFQKINIELLICTSDLWWLPWSLIFLKWEHVCYWMLVTDWMNGKLLKILMQICIKGVKNSVCPEIFVFFTWESF